MSSLKEILRRGWRRLAGAVAIESQGDSVARTPRAAVYASDLNYLINDDGWSEAAHRLLVFADGPGATQVISFDLPLRKLRDAGRLKIKMVSEETFDHLSVVEADRATAKLISDLKPTHLVVSRFAGKGAAGICRSAREYGLSFTMHLDDNLFAVPKELGPSKYKKYADPARLHRLRLLCERAAKIYASTTPLKTRLDQMGFSTPVSAGEIYCAAPSDEMTAYDPAHRPRVFGYMGTAGHAADLEVIAPAIASVLEANPDLSFETFGSIKAPSSLKKAFGSRVREISAAGSYLEFLAQFSKMKWRCGLAPIIDSPFNACKANTKFIEYTTAGIPVVASDLAVYRDIAEEGRGVLARKTTDWADAINALVSDVDRAAAQVNAAQALVRESYSMPNLTKQLLNEIGLDGLASNGNQ